MQQHLSARNNIFYVYFFNITRVYSSSLLCSIVGRNRLPFSRYIQILYIFAQILKCFVLFSTFLCSFSEKSHPRPYFLEWALHKLFLQKKKNQKRILQSICTEHDMIF